MIDEKEAHRNVIGLYKSREKEHIFSLKIIAIHLNIRVSNLNGTHYIMLYTSKQGLIKLKTIKIRLNPQKNATLTSHLDCYDICRIGMKLPDDTRNFVAISFLFLFLFMICSLKIKIMYTME